MEMTEAEKEFDRYLRECWRPPVRLPGADGTHEPVEIELAVDELARRLDVARPQVLAFWAGIQRAARTVARKPRQKSFLISAKLASVDFDPDREPTTIGEAKRLQKYWRDKRAELERAVASGELVPVERIRQQLAELKTAVLAIPRQAQRQIPSITNDDVAAMEATLRRVLRRGDDRLTRLTAKADDERPEPPREDGIFRHRRRSRPTHAHACTEAIASTRTITASPNTAPSIGPWTIREPPATWSHRSQERERVASHQPTAQRKAPGQNVDP